MQNTSAKVACVPLSAWRHGVPMCGWQQRSCTQRAGSIDSIYCNMHSDLVIPGAAPNKRQRVDVKGRPSDFGSVKKGEPYLLQPLRSDTNLLQQSKACFITGRPMVAPVRGALSAALLAPEFGIILDAFWRDLGNPTPYYFQVSGILGDRGSQKGTSHVGLHLLSASPLTHGTCPAVQSHWN